MEIQNHPVFYGFADKISLLRERKAGEPNAFVVGEANYTRFLNVMMECAHATMDLQKD